MIRDVHPGSGSRFRFLMFFPSRIPFPGTGGQKEPDPGSATLLFSAKRSAQCSRGWSVRGSALSSETSPAHIAIWPGTGSSTVPLVFAHALDGLNSVKKMSQTGQCFAMSFFAYSCTYCSKIYISLQRYNKSNCRNHCFSSFFCLLMVGSGSFS
jgi:hypothetical protein